MRKHRMGRIAQQRHRSSAPAVDGIAIEQLVESKILAPGCARDGAELIVEHGAESLDESRDRLTGSNVRRQQ